MLKRHPPANSIRTALARSRAAVLSGPRQSGKTATAQQLLDPASGSCSRCPDFLPARRWCPRWILCRANRGMINCHTAEMEHE